MDLQDKSREGRPKGTGCECSCCGARPPGEQPGKTKNPCRPGPGDPTPSPRARGGGGGAGWLGAGGAAGRGALLPAAPVVPSCASAGSWGACRTCRTSCTDRAYRRCGRACASSCRCCWRSAGRSPQTHTGTASRLWEANMGTRGGHPGPLGGTPNHPGGEGKASARRGKKGPSETDGCLPPPPSSVAERR